MALRFGADGAPDPSFGEAGAALLPAAGPGGATPVGMALPPDGTVVLAGNDAGGPLLVRLRRDGSPDPNFGSTGATPLSLGTQGKLDVIAPAADGKLLVAGTAEGYPFRAVVARWWN